MSPAMGSDHGEDHICGDLVMSECTCGGQFLDLADYRDHLPCPGTPEQREIARLKAELAARAGPTVWTYVIRTRESWRAWAKFFLDSEGALTVISDHGNYGYHWTSWGDGDFREFLLGLDNSYLGGKLRPEAYRPELDEEASVKAVREHILQARRAQEMSRESARHEWDLIEDYLDDNDVHGWMDHTELTDAYEYLVYRQWPGQLHIFLERVWPLFCAELRKALG